MCANQPLRASAWSPPGKAGLLPLMLVAGFLFSTGVASALVSGDAVFVTDVNSGAIRKFNSAGQGSFFGSVGTVNPVGLAVDAAGNLFVANRSGGVSGTITRFDPAGHSTLFSSQMDFPSGLAFGPDGQLYAAMVGNNTVEKFDSAGNATVFANSGLNGPLDIAFDHSGNLYAANQNDSSIVKLSSLGQPTFFASSGLYPDGLAFDGNDNLYVANFGDNTVQRIDPAGHSTIFASGLNAPVDVAFDGSGNLFVLNAGDGTILKFDATGHSSLFANTGLAYADSLAMFVVPEPGAAAVLVLGSAVLLLRKRTGKLSLDPETAGGRLERGRVRQ